MINSTDELAAEIAKAERSNNLERLKELESYFRAKAEPAPQPFMPAVTFNEAAFPQGLSLKESEFALPFANSLGRSIKKVQYNLKRQGGYSGPIIVAEGDSWFEYPVILLDVIDHLLRDYAVLSLAGAGHHLSEMVAINEYTQAIQDEGADIFLISGGGNDLLHGGNLFNFLVNYVEGMEAKDLLNRAVFATFSMNIVSLYTAILTSLTQRFPRLTILAHGYDYALARDNGTWLGKPLARRAIPPALWNEVVEEVIDEFNLALKSLEALFPGRFFHIDCRGRVGGQKTKWFDELHPKDAGYERVAARFKERIEALQQVAPFHEAVAAPMARGARPPTAVLPPLRRAPTPAARQNLTALVTRKGMLGAPEVANSIARAVLPTEAMRFPIASAPAPIATPMATPIATARGFAPRAPITMTEAIINATRPAAAPVPFVPPSVAPSLWSIELEEWQALFTEEDLIAYNHCKELEKEIDEPESEARIETRRELTPGFDISSFERIVGQSNIFQVNFLSRGERAARAVGRISVVNKYGISIGFGSGYLVAPNLLLTNNHVLPEPDLARHSYILFEYEYDSDHGLKQAERFDFTPDIFLTSEELDFTFVSVASTGRSGRKLSDFGHLLLIRESGKAVKGEYVSILQHANGLPKQIAIRDSQILGRKEQYIYYYTDTNSGSSGSPVVNDNWFPVALHHRAVPDYERPYQYIANRGIRISSIFERLEQGAAQKAMAKRILALLEPNESVPFISSEIPAGTFDTDGHSENGSNGFGATEAWREPFHEIPYDNRQGYDEDYLGIAVPLPTIRNLNIVAKRTDIRPDNRSHLIPYEHFTLALHKKRRTALFTASNVDASERKQRPEPNRDYSRDGLGGLGGNDRERWFFDPRLATQDQLSDRFFNRDNGAFDKGHLVRRNDVTWGDSYDQVRRANGDTFHLTNCSPQVAGFNQSGEDGLWGNLEDLIFAQGKRERYSIIAGPVLDPSDKSFRGVDDRGEVLVQIPAKYWKIVIARKEDKLQSFAFLLEQDLSDVSLEFQVDAAWRQRMIAISALEVLVRHLRFPQILHDTDQARTDHGESLRRSFAIELLG